MGLLKKAHWNCRQWSYKTGNENCDGQKKSPRACSLPPSESNMSKDSLEELNGIICVKCLEPYLAHSKYSIKLFKITVGLGVLTVCLALWAVRDTAGNQDSQTHTVMSKINMEQIYKFSLLSKSRTFLWNFFLSWNGVNQRTITINLCRKKCWAFPNPKITSLGFFRYHWTHFANRYTK